MPLFILFFFAHGMFKVFLFILAIILSVWGCKTVSKTSTTTPPLADIEELIPEATPGSGVVIIDEVESPKTKSGRPTLEEDMEAAKNAVVAERVIPKGYKQYLIRHNGFMYTDEAMEVVAPSGIDTVYNSPEATRVAILKQQKTLVQPYTLDDLFFYSTSVQRLLIWSYYKKQFDIDVRDMEYKEFFVFDRSKGFPPEASEEQVDYILRAGGVNMVEVFPLNEAPKFYAADPNPEFWKIFKRDPKWIYADEFIGPLVYNSKDEAIEKSNKMSTRFSYQGNIPGTLEELSDTPELLKAYIDAQEKISYSSDANAIILTNPYDSETEIIGLLALFKHKPYFLKEMDIKEAKSYLANFKFY